MKIKDEAKGRKAGEPYQFQVKTPEAHYRLADRIRALYEEQKAISPDVFIEGVKIDAIVLATVVSHLEGIDLTHTELDVKGMAFERFVDSFFKGDFGQYFTPREIIDFAVEMLPPEKEDLVLDPACGSGGSYSAPCACGFGTKVHAAVNGLSLPVKLVLTPGQAADVTQAEMLLADVPFEVVIGDKGFDSKKLVAFIEARGGEAVSPCLKNRATQRAYDRERYKDRHLVERFWNKIKHYRRVATRYEKTARNFLAFIHVASIMVLLQ